MLTGALIGLVVGVVVIVMNRNQAKAGTGLPGEIEQKMRGKGPMNLKQISVLVGKDSFMGRGKVGQALAGLQSAGKIKMTPAPEGTAQLQKVDHITYEVLGEPGRSA
ncbi:MAG: hypothetical protein ACKV2T_23625 [Kofleriaceae bacterium]